MRIAFTALLISAFTTFLDSANLAVPGSVPFRLGVNARCNDTNDDFTRGPEDETYVLATIWDAQGNVTVHKTPKFDVRAGQSFITAIHEGKLAPGQTVSYLLVTMEEDGGLSPAVIAALQASAEQIQENKDDPDYLIKIIKLIPQLINPIIGAGDDKLGAIACKLTCSSDGSLVLETKPSQDAAAVGPNRVDLSGENSQYRVETWVHYLEPPPESTTARIESMAHVENIGDTPFVAQGQETGTMGRSLGLEGLTVRTSENSAPIALRYKGHISGQGDADWVGLGQYLGSRGQSRAIEAIWMELDGPAADRYDVWYSVHIASYGWTGWVRNGQQCGSTGCSRRIEAFRAYIAEKAK